MIHKKTRQTITLVLIALAASSFVMTAINAYWYVHARQALMAAGEARMDAESARVTAKINAAVRVLKEAVDQLARDASNGKLGDRALDEALRQLLIEHPRLFEVGIAYLADARGTGTGLVAPHYARQDGKIHAYQLGESGDYTALPWFSGTLERGAGWVEPCCGDTAQTLVTGYAAPVYRPGEATPGRKPIGVIRATISLRSIADLAGTFRMGKTGYGYILSRDGHFIQHPVEDVLTKHKTIFELMADRPGKNIDKMERVLKKALAGEDARIEFDNPQNGQTVRLVFRPIPAAGWSFASVYLKSEILPYDPVFHHRQVLIILGMIVTLTALAALAFRAPTLGNRNLWAVSIVFSILCLAGTGAIWKLESTIPLESGDDAILMTDAAVLNKFITDHDRALAELGKTAPVWIPTGIQVQSLEFSDANDLVISGYVWQKFTDGVHDGIEPGVTMPEAQAYKATEAYRTKNGPVTTVGWYVEATLRESFDNSKYPFDRPWIGIWLRSTDASHPVMLEPDLGAYRFLTPAARPGLQTELTIPGFVILGTFFTYDEKMYNTDYGIGNNRQFGAAPELMYTVVAKRKILTPFLSRVFPLIILLAILFIVLLTFSKDEEKRRSFGLSGLTVLGVVITFLFTTLIAQGNLRQELGADRIIYLEAFYFITYFVLLLVAIKTFLFTGNKNIPLVQYEQGLIPKLLFWPLVTGLVLAVSIMHFY